MATTITAGNVTNGAAISSDNTGILELKTGTGSGTTAITVNTSQNVGIGTSSPNSRLDVNGLITARATGAGEGGQIDFLNPDNSATGLYIDVSTADVGRIFSVRNNSTLTLGQLVGTGGIVTFYTAATERARITSDGLFQFNSGYGSVATAYGCRAWVNFNGTAAGTFAGGTSTVTRVAGSTTATVTTTTAHGLITGNQVYALTGVAAGAYTITYISDTSFSFTTVATTALTNASITFAVNSIRASGNVSSVADNGVGDYTVNFTTAMPDANYSAVTALGPNGFPSPTSVFTSATTSAFRFTSQGVSAGSAVTGDSSSLSVTVFR